MEIAASPQPLVHQPEQTRSAILVISALGLLATFIIGVLTGASGSVRPLAAEKTKLARSATTADTAKIRREAESYLGFWENRESRMEKAAQRLGWKNADLAKAMRLIDAAKPRFEAVAVALRAGDDPTLKREFGLLYEQLALTYCEEFHLSCRRGVAPDQARSKKTVHKPSGKTRRAVSFGAA